MCREISTYVVQVMISPRMTTSVGTAGAKRATVIEVRLRFASPHVLAAVESSLSRVPFLQVHFLLAAADADGSRAAGRAGEAEPRVAGAESAEHAVGERLALLGRRLCPRKVMYFARNERGQTSRASIG